MAIPAPASTGVDVEVPPPAEAEAPRWRRVPWAGVVVGAAVAFGVAARFVAHSNLWLDEALTVNISGLPLVDIPGALRHDGSPPLYYFILHFWMDLLGSSTVTVRALSGIFSVACLPLAWRVGLRLGGRAAAMAVLVLLALSPFAVQYATEARMYSLGMLLVLGGGLALANLHERRSRPLSAAVALLTGALLLTHYYALYTVATAGALMLWLAWRGEERAAARRCLAAIIAGGLLFLPWVPIFLFQAAHTGAPWGRSGRGLRTVIDTLGVLVSGYRDAGPAPLLLAVGLIALAVFGRAVGRHRFEIDLIGREPARTLAVLTLGGLLLAVFVSKLTGQAYVPRYASLAFPGVIILLALGVASFADVRLRAVAMAATAGLGLVGIRPIMASERTQAADVAAHLAESARPGDVVAYCPDQLGPSVRRLLPDEPAITHLTYPRAGDPEFVDWVDYAETIRATPVLPFAQMLLQRAGPEHSVWLVWSPGYKGFEERCEQLLDALGGYRHGGENVEIRKSSPEKLGLSRFDSGARSGLYPARCSYPPGC